MKRCPECRRDYYDETLLYCLDDGAWLQSDIADYPTEVMPQFGVPQFGVPPSGGIAPGREPLGKREHIVIQFAAQLPLEG